MMIVKKITSKIVREYYKLAGRRKEIDAVRWGVVGLGAMAEVFTNALDASREASVVAVASRNIEKAKAFAGRHHVGQAYGSYEDMLGKEKHNVDIIYIATPQKYHYEHIKMCLVNGYNVMCEKPITSNVEQLQELMVLAQENNVFLMEGMWSYCLPTYQKAKEWVLEGRIGDIIQLDVALLKEEQEDIRQSRFNPKEGGGVLLDYGVYALAFCTFFMNRSLSIDGYERKNRESGIDAEWSISLNDGKIKAQIDISSIRKGKKSAVIVGNNGSIVFDEQFNRTNRVILLDEKGNKVDEFRKNYVFEGFEYEVAEVNEAIRNKRKECECVPLKTSLKTLELIDILLERK